ncbi:hypothetical protein YH69_31490 [Pseudomonas aeruginosa]|nr:hypothetical protein YH69_31490 [Pseudomonas aeruginosa]KSP73878.1 hypothetical protein APB12_12430 [Pseudomonas aeruginosa]
MLHKQVALIFARYCRGYFKFEVEVNSIPGIMQCALEVAKVDVTSMACIPKNGESRIRFY